MVVGTILKALRVEAARLAAVGTDRLRLCARKAKKDVWISPRFERALLDELRVKAAIAVLRGASTIELSETLDGQEFHNLVLHVEPEQYADVRTQKPLEHVPPATRFGSFA